MTRSLTFCICMMILPAIVLGVDPKAADDQNIVYDFSATWCGPCRQMAPIVERLEREGLRIRKVDIDKEKELADRFNISSIPAFVVVVNGKEVQRQSGAISESSLRNMIAKLPPTSATPASGIELGEARPMSELAMADESASPKTDSMGDKLKRLLPFGKDSSTEEDVTVRGNDSSLDSATDSQTPIGNLSANPMDSSVRIRVVIDGKINLGSGTIIQSQEGLTKILTCAHIFRGFDEDSKIEIDLSINNRVEQRIAKLESINEEADLGLISVATSRPLPVAAIAKVDHAPTVGEKMVGIGCSGGEPATQERVQVTAIDKYVGPHNVECTGLPVRGRSGGGLFNAQGEIVGVCIAADKEYHRGLYSGLFAVHSLLNENQMAYLFKEPIAPAENVNIADNTPKPSAIAPAFPEIPGEFTAQPEILNIAATPPATQPALSPVDVNAGRAEVVVIIRDPAQKDGQNRVVVIHDASSKFLSYLNGELDEHSAAAGRILSLSGSESSTKSGQRIVINHSINKTSATMSNYTQGVSQLEQTSLTQPLVPRKYVRANSNSAVQ